MLSFWFIYYLVLTYFLKGFEEAGDFLSMVPSRKGGLIKLFGKGVQSNKISKDDTDQNPLQGNKNKKMDSEHSRNHFL